MTTVSRCVRRVCPCHVCVVEWSHTMLFTSSICVRPCAYVYQALSAVNITAYLGIKGTNYTSCDSAYFPAPTENNGNTMCVPVCICACCHQHLVSRRP